MSMISLRFATPVDDLDLALEADIVVVVVVKGLSTSIVCCLLLL